jgi:A/G-specific adenine glycosylase
MPNRAPLCGECPLREQCCACADGSWDRIPYRAPKKGRRIMHKLILLLHDGEGRYAIRRRPAEGLLAGLWELPQIDLPDEDCAANEEQLDWLAREFCRQNGLLSAESASAPQAKHIFTHLEWHMCGRYLNVEKIQETTDLLFVSAEELSAEYALPTAFRAYARYIHGK